MTRAYPGRDDPSQVKKGKIDTMNDIAEDGHGASYQDLCDILRAQVEEIVRLILIELPRSEYETLVPAGLVFTGGSSNLSGGVILQ